MNVSRGIWLLCGLVVHDIIQRRIAVRGLSVLVIAVAASGLALASCESPNLTPLTPVPTSAGAPVVRPSAPTLAGRARLSWNGAVGSIFFSTCKSCHGGLAGLTLTSYGEAMRGSMRGPVIVPGRPADSKLVIKQSEGGHPGQLTPDQLETVKDWIAQGAPEN